MANTKQLLSEWMADDSENAAEVILALVATLSAGKRTALRDRVRADIKAKYAIRRSNFDDTDVDALTL